MPGTSVATNSKTVSSPATESTAGCDSVPITPGSGPIHSARCMRPTSVIVAYGLMPDAYAMPSDCARVAMDDMGPNPASQAWVQSRALRLEGQGRLHRGVRVDDP